jgi:hypothetical protein
VRFATLFHAATSFRNMSCSSEVARPGASVSWKDRKTAVSKAVRDWLTPERLVGLGIAAVVSVATGLLSDWDTTVIFGSLGVLALIYATVQFGDARNTIRDLHRVSTDVQKLDAIREQLANSTSRLEELAGEVKNLQSIRDELKESTDRLEEQLSTHRIGKFPHFLHDVVKLLRAEGEEAEEEIFIFCDFPAYGVFSGGDGFDEYVDAVAAKSEKITLLCLDHTRRVVLINEQVSNNGWEDWRSSHQSELKEYLERNGHPFSSKRINQEAFVKILDQSDGNVIDNQLAAATIWLTEMVMPLYFWIIGKRAIFALVPFMEEEELEVGFETVDETLIKALMGVFHRYETSAQTSLLKSRRARRLSPPAAPAA